jgi:hypothetical protein
MYRVYCLIIGLVLAWCGSALTIWIPEGLHYWPNILQVGLVTISSIVGAVGFIIIMLVLFEWWLTSESFESDHERRQKRNE